MQIKKFTADSLAAAMSLVKKEFGENALILNTRTFPQDHKFPLSKNRSRVEITAAVDFASLEAKSSTNIEAESLAPRQNSAEVMGGDLDLKALVYTLLTQTDRAKSMGLANDQLEIYKKLADSGVNERMAARMFEKINSLRSTASSANPPKDKTLLTDLMRRVLLCNGGIAKMKGYPKVAAFVGPTGVGKTTTIAKLAAHYSVKERKKVALISLDTYRIGAVEQLKVYGGIMKVPVDVATGPRDFQKLLGKHSDKDFIFVDTTGKCHKDHEYANRLSEILRKSGPMETHLVLSVTLQEKIFEETFKQFSSLKPDKVLFTKLDEGINFGSLFNFSLRTRLPFSYFTTGQRVPEDIEVADREKVIRLIFN